MVGGPGAYGTATFVPSRAPSVYFEGMNPISNKSKAKKILALAVVGLICLLPSALGQSPFAVSYTKAPIASQIGVPSQQRSTSLPGSRFFPGLPRSHMKAPTTVSQPKAHAYPMAGSGDAFELGSGVRKQEPRDGVATRAEYTGMATNQGSQGGALMMFAVMIGLASIAGIAKAIVRPKGKDPSTMAMLSYVSSDRHETAEQTAARRAEESLKVDERFISIHSLADLRKHLKADPDRLCILQVESDENCMTGLEEEPEVQWKVPQSELMAPCRKLHNTLSRTARNCTDVTFLDFAVQKGDPDSDELQKKLQIETTPSLLFILDGRVVWSHSGVQGATDDLRDGMLYYSGTDIDGQDMSKLVRDIHSLEEAQEFLTGKSPSLAEAEEGGKKDVLRAMLVGVTKHEGCIHMFPAVTALSKHMKGKASFARLLGDESQDTADIFKALDISHIPTLIIYDTLTGREAWRSVVSSRGDLIGQYLQTMEKVTGEKMKGLI